VGRDAQQRHVPSRVRTARGAALLAVLAAVLAGAVPFFVSVTAWPEIVAPAWFVANGWTLYEHILFPHTPALILLTAAAGRLLGFHGTVLRAFPAAALAASAALLVLGTRPHRVARRGPWIGLLAGLPLLVLVAVYVEGPALWPEPFLAPLMLGAVLLLERHERRGGPRLLAGAGLVFGAGILVKQTAAWPAAAAFLWLASRSRRRGAGAAALFGAAVALPYLVFSVTWAAAFRTLAHLRWTLVYPLFSGMSRDIATPFGPADLHEAVVLFLPLAAAVLLGTRRFPEASRSPLVAVTVGSAFLAWPRFGLLHLAAGTGLVVLAACRSLLVLAASTRRARTMRARIGSLVASGFAAAALAAFVGVAVLGAGPFLADARGGPVFSWDDSTTRALVRTVKTRVVPGGELLVYEPHQTLYALTGTRAPGGFYVHPLFWYCLSRDGGDERLVAALEAHPGLPVLFHEPIADVARVRATRVYSFLATRTEEEGLAPPADTWRRVTGRR
jgi:hypothetical protein